MKLLKQTTYDVEQLSEQAPVIVVGEDNSIFVNLAASLTEIRKLKGVTGYILRSNTAAIIDLTQKESVIEYAILSSQIHEYSEAIAKQFNLADIENVMVEGQTTKVLCMCIDDNRLAIFMDKTCDHSWIVKRLHL